MDTQKHIFLIGNPLLDISAEFKDNAILDKYKLEPGMASLASPEQIPIYDELWHTEGRLAIPGGSALNSARACNYILKNQDILEKVNYFGSIGNCDKGHTLEKVLQDEGVKGNFHKTPESKTGTCAVIVVNKDRTLCADLAAACEYQLEHLHANLETVKTASLIYSTSFFITSNPTALHEVAKTASDLNIPFAYNLSAVFLVQFELENVLKSLVHADYIFANEDEAAAFGKSQNMEGDDLKEVAKVLAKWEKSNTKRPRVAIVTYGAKPVIVATHMPGTDEVTLQEFEVSPLAADQIVDTNGAGDAFVGGFLSQLYQGKEVKDCISAGIYLSREVVQRSGCCFPDKMEWTA